MQQEMKGTGEREKEKRLWGILAARLRRLEEVAVWVRILGGYVRLLQVKMQKGAALEELAERSRELLAGGLPEVLPLPAGLLREFFARHRELDISLEARLVGTSVREILYPAPGGEIIELPLARLLARRAGLALLGEVDLTGVNFGGGLSLRELVLEVQGVKQVLSGKRELWQL